MNVILPLVIILILIAINGVFVAAEFAIIGVRPSLMKQLADEGNKTAQWVQHIITDRGEADRYIATSQLGITLASLGLGMYGEPAISRIIGEPALHALGFEGEIVHTISFLFGLFLITYLHVVVGEMVPKSIALQSAARMVLALAAPMRFIERIFSIPVKVLNSIGVLVLRLFNFPIPDEDTRAYGPNELELIVSESYAGGMIEEYEQTLIENIFDFSERRAGQIMTPRTHMTAIPVDISEAALLEMVESSPFTRLPVYKETIDNVIGSIHIKDVVRQQLSGEPFNARSLLRQISYVPESLPVESLLNTLRATHQHMAVVIDEHGGTLGLVTMEDMIEEIIGEVQDEFDVQREAPLRVVEPGYLLARGTVLIDDVEQIVPLGEIDYDVQTIGGLVLAEIGHPPSVGDTVKLKGVTLRVEEMDELAVEQVSIRFGPALAEG